MHNRLIGVQTRRSKQRTYKANCRVKLSGAGFRVAAGGTAPQRAVGRSSKSAATQAGADYIVGGFHWR